MKLSLSVTNFSWPDGPIGLRDQLERVVRAADVGGLDTVWIADHVLQGDPMSTPEDAMLEAYTTLGFMAACSERVRLGAAVTPVTYRSPAMLIKMVTTLDVLTKGRAWLGIGAGYHELEARSLGVFLPPTRERFERLEETLRLALQMWSGDDSAFNGKYYQLERPVNSPNSVQRPHPPILIGGTGERRTLPLVAKYADACNVFDIPDGGVTVRHQLEVLAGACAEIGRDFAEIEKTIGTALAPGESAESFVERCKAIAELGIDHVVVITRGVPWAEATIGTLTAAVPALQTVGYVH